MNLAKLLTAVAIVSACAGCEADRGADEPYGASVVFGDSLAYGIGATPGHDLASCLGAATGFTFVNRGVPGATTRDALARLPRLLSLGPPTVVISIGGNDLLRDLGQAGEFWRLHHAFPAAETLGNLRRIFEGLGRIGARVIYVDVTPPWVWRDPRTMYARFDRRLSRARRLARATPGVTVVDAAMDGIWTRRELMTDDLHPNDAGYAILCDRVRQKILLTPPEPPHARDSR